MALVSAAARVQSLAYELLHVVSMAKKKKKKIIKSMEIVMVSCHGYEADFEIVLSESLRVCKITLRRMTSVSRRKSLITPFPSELTN